MVTKWSLVLQKRHNGSTHTHMYMKVQEPPKLMATDKKKRQPTTTITKGREREISNVKYYFVDIIIISWFQLLHIWNSETHDFIRFHMVGNYHNTVAVFGEFSNMQFYK